MNGEKSPSLDLTEMQQTVSRWFKRIMLLLEMLRTQTKFQITYGDQVKAQKTSDIIAF